MGGYSQEPADKVAYRRRADRMYGRFARVYDVAVRRLPVWRTWLDHATPLIQGPRVLEVSFGTGYLLNRYAGRFETFGADLNWEMVRVARRNAAASGHRARLLQSDVEALPYDAETFDTVVNTMAFSGYPDGRAALTEIRRVLKPGGRLVLMDVGFPQNGNAAGVFLTNLWKVSGDVIRDMPALLRDFEFDVAGHEIGGFGSVHLYVALKPGGGAPAPGSVTDTT